MLKTSSIGAALNDISVVTNNAKRLSVNSGTPLHLLTTSISILDVNEQLENGVDPVEYIHKASRRGNDHTGHPHDLAMEEFVKTVKVALNVCTSVVRGHALPIINAAMDNADQMMADIASENVTIGVVVERNITSVAANPMFIDMLNEYRADATTARFDVSGMPILSATDIRDVCKSDMIELAKNVSDFLDDRSDEWLETTYRKIIMNQHIFGGSFTPTYRTKDFDVSELVLAVLIISNIESHIDTHFNGINLSLADLRMKINDVMSAICYSFKQLDKLLERQAKYNTLVINNDIMVTDGIVTNKIEVNPTVYNRFLESGGSVEALIGAVFKNVTDYDDIITNAGKYEGYYNNQVAIRRRTQDEVIKGQTRGIIKRSIELALQSHYENSDRKDAVITAVNQLDAYLTSMPNRTFEINKHQIGKIVCKALFPGTSADVYIEEMVAIREQNPNISTNQVAALAAIEVYTTWCASQLELKSVG